MDWLCYLERLPRLHEQCKGPARPGGLASSAGAQSMTPWWPLVQLSTYWEDFQLPGCKDYVDGSVLPEIWWSLHVNLCRWYWAPWRAELRVPWRYSRVHIDNLGSSKMNSGFQNVSMRQNLDWDSFPLWPGHEVEGQELTSATPNFYKGLPSSAKNKPTAVHGWRVLGQSIFSRALYQKCPIS